MTLFPALDSLLTRVLRSRAQERRVLFFGLDAAGKTTLLYRLALSEVVTTIPTIGFNVESVRLPLARGKTMSLAAWDVGGCDKIRPLWRHYFDGLQGAIFMVDANDRERMDGAVEECGMFMQELKGAPVPWLVFANKQDLGGAMTPLEVHTRFLQALPEGTDPRSMQVYPLSAIAQPKDAFMQQILPAFTWFHDAMESPALIAPAAAAAAAGTSTAPHAPAPAPAPAFDPRAPAVLAARLESWIARAAHDAPPAEFLAQFHAYTLPAWDHYTHVRLAHVVLTTHGRQRGKDILFDGIRAYIAHSPQATGRSFHVTMTYFWIQLVHYAIASLPVRAGGDADDGTDTFALVLALNPHLCDGMLWADYYEKGTMMSPEAKAAMVLPDKQPLPNLVQRDAPPKGSVPGLGRV